MRILLFIIALASVSCTDMFDYSPYIVDFTPENSSANARYIDSSLETEFHSMIAKYDNVLLTLHGHTHKHEITEPYQDNILYINTYGVQQQSFYIDF